MLLFVKLCEFPPLTRFFSNFEVAVCSQPKIITAESYEEEWRGTVGHAHRSDCLRSFDDFMCDGWKIIDCDYWCNNILDCQDEGDEIFCPPYYQASAIQQMIDTIKAELDMIEKLLKKK